MSKQRLIDANALKTERGMADRCEDCKHDARMCQFNQDYTRMDICGMLDDAPTIDAIPVSWLREKMLRPQMKDGNPFGFVLAEWLEEQGARA